MCLVGAIAVRSSSRSSDHSILVARDDADNRYTVRYDGVNAMLLNKFLKKHPTVQEQQKEIGGLRAELKEQRAFIEKVNDKVELNRPASRPVLNASR